MPCLTDRCPVPTSCQHSGSCRHRQIDAARSYEVAIAAKRARDIVPFKDKEDSA